MKAIIIISLLLLTLISFGQISFEKGYYIDNNNHKIDCLIKNNDRQNNPTTFEYKLSEKAITQKVTINSAKEFTILGESKFIRADVNIDRSPTDLKFLTYQRKPMWSKEKLFLKVLMEGNASLYYFRFEEMKRYFYSVSGSPIQQLVYKEYLITSTDLGINYEFRYQLSRDFSYKNNNEKTSENVNYDHNSLLSYFKDFNECSGSSFIEYVGGKKHKKSLNTKGRELFTLKVTPGLNSTSISFTDVKYPDHYTDFGNKLSLRLGIETEFILPFNKNKWGLLIEPTFQYYNSEIQNSYGKGQIQFKSIEFPFGIRYFVFLNNKLKLFTEGLFIPGVSPDFNSKVIIPLGGTSIGTKEIQSTNSLAFGLGIEYIKISMEMRYYSNRDILHNYRNYDVSYSRISAILGFRIF